MSKPLDQMSTQELKLAWGKRAKDFLVGRKIVDVYENDMYRFLPRKVITVTADLITQNKDGSLGLRFPRKTRLRDDKYVQDIDTIQTVERLMFG